MTSNDEIRMEQHVAASPSRVWEALIRPGLWWGDEVTLDPSIGGQFLEPWSDGEVVHRTSGTITELEPPHLLAMSWKDEDWSFETGVVITITGEGERAVILLQHVGWEAAPPDERGRLVADHRSGWSRHFKDLAACAESMTDKN
jgi:uncharacterized protein YndB with AHSA1/START domain